MINKRIDIRKRRNEANIVPIDGARKRNEVIHILHLIFFSNRGLI